MDLEYRSSCCGGGQSMGKPANLNKHVSNEDPQALHFQTTLAEWDRLEKENKELKDKIKIWRSSVTRDPDFDFIVNDEPQNESKNRYADVKPLESTRVKLKNGESDYINGNWVCSPHKPSKQYIATQAPLPHTFGDFWFLVWQEECTTIVMLTDLQEQSTKKADCYWPGPGEMLTFGNIIISSVQQEKKGTYYRREFLIAQSGKEEKRTVHQLQGCFWNDLGVPSNCDMESILQGLSALERPNNAPLIVHCSAGLGRAGTFILIHTMLEHAKETKTPFQLLNFVDALSALRKQRYGMVCTWGQYLFAKNFVQYSLDNWSEEAQRSITKRKREGKEKSRKVDPKRKCLDTDSDYRVWDVNKDI